MPRFHNLLPRRLDTRLLTGLVAVAVLAGVASFGVTLTSLGSKEKSAGGASAAGQRLLVTGQSEDSSAVTSIVVELQNRGFTLTKAPANLSSLGATTIASAVFTANGLHSTAPDAVRSLYAQGIVIAGINISLPDLSAIVEPNGPSVPTGGPAVPPPAPSSSWLPVSTQYTVFSVMALGSKISDRWVSADSFVSILQLHEPGSPLPSVSPGPLHGPSQPPPTPASGR